jgi:hypothetical protein
MGTVVSCREFAKAGRARLSGKLETLLAALGKLYQEKPTVDDRPAHRIVENQIGALIVAESQKKYCLTEVPAQIYNAPWLYVIKRLAEEFPARYAEIQKLLLDVVSAYLEEPQSVAVEA